MYEVKLVSGINSYKLKCEICSNAIYRSVKRVDQGKIYSKTCQACSLKLSLDNRVVRAYSCDRFYFSDKSLQSAYWAGFIAADGCINKNNVLSIKIHNRDRDRLERFLLDTNSTNPILDTKGQDQGRVMISCADWVKDLEGIYNIGSVKSLTYTHPNLVDENLIKAFIVGYIDGDGSICYLGKERYLKLGICGTKETLEWIKGYFDSWVSPTKAKCSISYKKGKHEAAHEYVVYGKRALSILSLLNNLDLNKMSRKWNKLNKENYI